MARFPSLPQRCRSHRFRCLVTASLLSGCTVEGPPPVVVEVTDSAGITLVQNRGEPPEDGGGWSVSAEPLLTIGTFQGDSLQQLYQVQGAVRLPDGRIAVANEGSGEVRLYDRDGVFLTAHGGKGEGPGEFQSLALAGRLGGDTLVVVDLMLRRISLVHAREGFLTSARLGEELGGGAFPQGLFADGTIVLGGGFYWSGDSGDQLKDGYTRPPTSYRAASLEGELVRDFGEFPGSEFFMQVRSTASGMMMSARLIPFGRHSMQAVGPDRLFVGSGDRWEITALDPSGAVERSIRWDRPPVPVTEQDLNAFIDREVEEAADPTAAQEIRQSLSEMPVPDQMPAFAGLSADARGYLWVERYRAPGDTLPVHDVLDPEGRVVGSIRLPHPVEILDIGVEHLLGLYEDELGVEYLHLYRLTRGSGG